MGEQPGGGTRDYDCGEQSLLEGGTSSITVGQRLWGESAGLPFEILS